MPEGEILVDGSDGEGGGQILRTSLTLSMATGKPFRIYRIRAGRKKPGLQRQHLASVRAAARVCGARVEGAEPGSQALSFRPGPVMPGDYAFALSGAGSSTLVCQTVLPALLAAGRPFRLALEGGTHNPSAPPLDFVERVYLAALARMGVEASIQVERRGFFPVGGGKWSIEVAPSAAPRPLRMLERGAPVDASAKVLWNRIPSEEPLRARAYMARELGWDPARIASEEAKESPGPGNVVLAELRYAHAAEVITAFNAFGASPEAVCQGLIADMRAYIDSGVPVGRRLADQLMVPMVLGAGGAFRTLPLSLHSRTNIRTIGKFLDRTIETEELEGGAVEIRIG